jgi:hypothetical protein
MIPAAREEVHDVLRSTTHVDELFEKSCTELPGHQETFCNESTYRSLGAESDGADIRGNDSTG